MLKVTDIKTMTADERTLKIKALRKELFDVKLEKATTSVEKPHREKQIKKDIARILTVANQKE